MEENKQEDIKEVIDELNEPVEPVEPAEQTEQVEPEPEPQPEPVNSDVINGITIAVIETLDIIQNRVCKMIAKKQDIDFRFTEPEKTALQTVWRPVVMKYYNKISVEFIAITMTSEILVMKFIEAKKIGLNKNAK